MFEDRELQRKIDKLIETYTVEELLELSDMTVSEAITVLVLEGYVQLPEIIPIDIGNDDGEDL